jgi:hypothetical protein
VDNVLRQGRQFRKQCVRVFGWLEQNLTEGEFSNSKNAGRNVYNLQYYSRTLTCEMGVVNMAIKLHNKLPMELRKEEGERKFKHKLKRYLLEHPYYTLQEFLSDGQ